MTFSKKVTFFIWKKTAYVYVTWLYTWLYKKKNKFNKIHHEAYAELAREMFEVGVVGR